MRIRPIYLQVLGAVFILLGCFLPWMSSNGIHLNGFRPDLGHYPALPVIGLTVAVTALVLFRRWEGWIPWLGAGLMVLVLHHSWRAFRLHAMGWGLLFLFLGAVLLLFPYQKWKAKF